MMFEQFKMDHSIIIENHNSKGWKKIFSNISTSKEKNNNMRLIEKILDNKNLNNVAKIVYISRLNWKKKIIRNINRSSTSIN